MNLKNKYKENYILLAAFRQYIEDGTMLASVNFWLDSAQNFKEFQSVQNRKEIIALNPAYRTNEFLLAFISEEFPKIDETLPEAILNIGLKLIDEFEGKETTEVVKDFLITYALNIAKSSKDSFNSFIGIEDSISDGEALFINKMRNIFYTNQ